MGARDVTVIAESAHLGKGAYVVLRIIGMAGSTRIRTGWRCVGESGNDGEQRDKNHQGDN